DRLVGATQSGAEARVSTQRSRRRSVEASRESRSGATRVLVLMPRTRRIQRTQRLQFGTRALIRGILPFVSLLAFVSFVPFVSLAARPGVIRGRVDVRRSVIPPDRRPGVADLGMPRVRDVPDVRRSVVYLESAPRGAFETNEGGHALMDQRNE